MEERPKEKPEKLIGPETITDSDLHTYSPNDPVHEEGGLWYFWDETWGFLEGPYSTEEIAREQLHRYGQYLDGKLPEQQSI